MGKAWHEFSSVISYVRFYLAFSVDLDHKNLEMEVKIDIIPSNLLVYCLPLNFSRLVLKFSCDNSNLIPETLADNWGCFEIVNLCISNRLIVVRRKGLCRNRAWIPWLVKIVLCSFSHFVYVLLLRGIVWIDEIYRTSVVWSKN